jgi:hypothetical protein
MGVRESRDTRRAHETRRTSARPATRQLKSNFFSVSFPQKDYVNLHKDFFPRFPEEREKWRD